MFDLVSWKDQKNAIEQFWKGIDDVFDSFNKTGENSFSKLFDFDTGVDIKEEDKNITVNIELPDVDPKDIDLSLVYDKYLKVKYEKKDKDNYRYFCETILLPSKAEVNDTSYKDDVLTIKFLKIDDPDVKKIEVK